MKLAFITLLTLTLSQTFAVISSKGDITTEERPFVIEYVMAELTRIHTAVYSLPFEEAYITGTLMPEIKAKREVLAPNFPDLLVTSENQADVQGQVSAWYAEHPEEFLPYIQFVDQFVADHQ
jgi:hypothetical protein